MYDNICVIYDKNIARSIVTCLYNTFILQMANICGWRRRFSKQKVQKI